MPTAPSHRQIITILGGLMIGMFLAALDQTIVATAIRTIGDSLHGLSLQAWVTTAYLITSTIATPLYGKLSDIYGRKPFYLLAIVLFLIGSLLSGTAHSMYQLAAYRGMQGLGAGGLMSLAFTILGDLVPPRERARYQGMFLAVFGTSSVLGPVIGGFFAGTATILGITGWRWVFLVNIPIGIVGLVVISRVLHLPPLPAVKHRIDWPGALALMLGLVPLLIVSEQGRSWGWSSTHAFTCYALGVIGIALFLLAERSAGADALLPLYLFRNRTFAIGAGTNTVIGLGMFGGLATLPLYLQIAKGMGPTQAGLTLIPLTMGIMSGSLISG
ncbi:MAG TPA: MFS transporter, partial [Pengzhenrongella sp.]